MKRFIICLLTGSLLCAGLAGCGASTGAPEQSAPQAAGAGDTVIVLDDGGITVDGAAISTDEAEAVYAAHDIVFYLEGQDFTYGEGSEADAHSQAEADAHTVVHITRPGTYVLSGGLSAGQIAVDLGDGAEEDPEAVVTLILNGVDITCSVAPAVIFYNVYECGSADTQTAGKDVDTSAAGANVIIADGTENTVTGSYVARIYKPDSVELSEDGTEVVNSKKLHKYDGAFYSKRSMNVTGGEEDTGILTINAGNEGLDSELHLTINGGNINITSGNDGINTNEDGVSVTTINGGTLNIVVTGSTGEGDGIDSNGWLVINGGTVTSAAYGGSQDAGIDSDMGIYVNGGVVLATGNMLDRLEEGGQNYAVFTFAQKQSGGTAYTLKNAGGGVAAKWTPANDFTCLVASFPELTAGEYTFWQGDTQLATSGAAMGGGMGPMGGMEMPEGFKTPENRPEGMPEDRPEGMPGGPKDKEGDMPVNDDGTITLPDGTTVDPTQIKRPEGGRGGGFGGRQPQEGEAVGELSDSFTVAEGGNFFGGVTAAQ